MCSALDAYFPFFISVSSASVWWVLTAVLLLSIIHPPTNNNKLMAEHIYFKPQDCVTECFYFTVEALQPLKSLSSDSFVRASLLRCTRRLRGVGNDDERPNVVSRHLVGSQTRINVSRYRSLWGHSEAVTAALWLRDINRYLTVKSRSCIITSSADYFNNI